MSRKIFLDVGVDQSGMAKVAVPINIDLDGLGVQTQFVEATAVVNMIHPKAKGIHMSRLYLSLSQRLERNLFNMEFVEQILEDFLSSHQGMSDYAYLKLAFKIFKGD